MSSTSALKFSTVFKSLQLTAQILQFTMIASASSFTICWTLRSCNGENMKDVSVKGSNAECRVLTEAGQ